MLPESETNIVVVNEPSVGSKKVGLWLEKLNLAPTEEFIFFHINYQRLRNQVSPADVIDGLFRYFSSKTTIIIPTYPFKGSAYWDHLKETPVFSIKTTPSKVSLVSEIFRRKPGVIRSLHPLLCVSAKGPHQEWIIENHEKARDCFGPLTPYGRLVEAGGKVVGLGCDINTNAFIHMVDDRIAQFLPFSVYEPEPIEFKCINSDGLEINVSSLVLEKTIGNRIKPRNLIPYLPSFVQNNRLWYQFFSEIFVENKQQEESTSEARFYAFDAKEFISAATQINEDQLVLLGKEAFFPVHYNPS